MHKMSTFVVLTTRQALPAGRRPRNATPTSPMGSWLPRLGITSPGCILPSTDILSVRPLPETEASFGSTALPAKSRSALVVSHHLDGFLRTMSHGLVASRCQPWGSTRFAQLSSQSPEGPSQLEPPSSHRSLTPFEEFPSLSSRVASLRPLHLLPLATRPVPRPRPRHATRLTRSPKRTRQWGQGTISSW